MSKKVFFQRHHSVESTHADSFSESSSNSNSRPKTSISMGAGGTMDDASISFSPYPFHYYFVKDDSVSEPMDLSYKRKTEYFQPTFATATYNINKDNRALPTERHAADLHRIRQMAAAVKRFEDFSDVQTSQAVKLNTLSYFVNENEVPRILKCNIFSSSSFNPRSAQNIADESPSPLNLTRKYYPTARAQEHLSPIRERYEDSRPFHNSVRQRSTRTQRATRNADFAEALKLFPDEHFCIKHCCPRATRFEINCLKSHIVLPCSCPLDWCNRADRNISWMAMEKNSLFEVLDRVIRSEF